MILTLFLNVLKYILNLVGFKIWVKLLVFNNIYEVIYLNILFIYS